MKNELSKLTSEQLVVAALPKLTDTQRQRLIAAVRCVMAIDTSFRSPVGSFRTNYRAQGQVLLAELLPELRAEYPEDPIVQAVVEEFSQDLPGAG